MEEKRIDTIFLDIAKAFDKVDHKILLEKVKKHGIGGKIGRLIEEFLKDRKFRVVVNGYVGRRERNLRSSSGNGTGGRTVCYYDL